MIRRRTPAERSARGVGARRPLSSRGPGECVGGRYQLVEEIGRGATSVVFAATDLATGRAVAVKLTLSEAHGQTARQERWAREARIASALKHPGIVRIYDSGVDGATPFIVMERLRGKDLARFLRSKRDVPLSTSVEIGMQLCDALHGAHEHGVVHRDVKPANVFVEEAESPAAPRVKILDFGLARGENGDGSLTTSGQVLGSLPYMAPELLDGAKRANAATDVYATVCVLYEMIYGRRAFRGDTLTSLRLAIRHDTPLVPSRFGHRVDEALRELFDRGLAKDPTRRFASAAELRDALRRTGEGAVPVFPGFRERSASWLPARFELQRFLGEGASGEVYAAFDRSLGRIVALKRLRTMTAERVSRIKSEFRLLADVDHPNLVRLESLWVENDIAFITMALVEGTPLSDLGSRAVESWRSIIAGIAEGLAALHVRGLVHRDLKPSNVLMDARGHAVVADFGLTAVAEERMARRAIEGTRRYLAPESLDGALSPAADMYALGVVLLELLGGAAAVEALAERTWTGEGERDLDALRRLAASAPDDGLALCAALVALDPAQRPDAAGVIERLGPRAAVLARGTIRSRNPAFVARHAELAELERALGDSISYPILVTLKGPTGIGKTALLDRFASEVRRGDALVLRSRCHRAETIALPALDGAVEGLAALLKTWPAEALSAITPRRVRVLCKLLPALEQVPWAARTETLPADPAEQRNRAVEALRELLQRLSDRRPLLLAIDDVQWMDAESARLLSLVLSSDPPNMLLLLALRNDAALDVPWARLVADAPTQLREIAVAGLTEKDGRELAAHLWAGPEPATESHLTDLVKAAKGSPFLISLFTEQAATAPGGSFDPARAIVARYRRMSASARRLLELASLVCRPMDAHILLRAARLPNLEEPLDELVQARLVRALPGVDGPLIEPFHATIAEAVTGALDDAERRSHHAALAAALAREAEPDDAALVAHTAAAGDWVEATRVAERAASRADCKLAFDGAAALYRVAVSHGPARGPGRVQLLVRLAEALRNAGDARGAGEAMLEASGLGEDERAGVFERRAGEFLLSSGDYDRGLQVLATSLERVGIELPAEGPPAIAEGLAVFGQLASRGLSFVPRSAEACSPIDLDRIDLCLSVAQSLHSIDLRSIVFVLRGLLFALDAGEPTRLQRALALFVANTAINLPNPFVQPALEICRNLTNELDDPYAAVLLALAEADVLHFAGDFLAVEALCENAERILLESCVGANRELADVRTRALLIQYSQKGDYRSILGRSTQWLEEATQRGNRFHANWLRAIHALAWVAQDRPEFARSELDRAEADWPGGTVFDVAVALYHDVIDRYCGDDSAHLHPGQGRASVLESPISRTPFLHGYICLHKAWGAVRAMHRDPADAAARAMAESALAEQRALGLALWRGCADAMEANALYLDGHRETAIVQLERCDRTLRQLGVLCLAACARKRRGQFIGGPIGYRIERDADAQLADLGIVAPDKFLGAYWGPFPIREDNSDVSTILGE